MSNIRSYSGSFYFFDNNRLLMRFFLVWLICGLFLTACGFHLRGSYHIPPDLQSLTLKSTPPPLEAILRKQLQQHRIKLINDAKYTLEIIEATLNKQTSSMDTRAKAAEYNLYYQVSYRIIDNSQDVVFPTHRLLLRRGYQYDNTAIVGKNSEEQTLILELYHDAAMQIIRQLTHFTPQNNSSPTP